MPALVCPACQQPVPRAAGWAQWTHQPPGTPPAARLAVWHTACRAQLAVAPGVQQSWLHLQVLPADLLGAWLVEPYFVAYAPTRALCLKHWHHLHPRTGIWPVWELTLIGAAVERAAINTTRPAEVVFHVPEFMEFSEIKLALASGQVLHFNRDLYDVVVRLYGHNRSENALPDPTQLPA